MEFNKRWSDVYVDQFCELLLIDLNEELSAIDRMIEKLTIVYDSDEFLMMSVDEISTIWRNHLWLSDAPSTKLYNQVEDYHLINFKKLTLGEWIDIDTWVKDIPKNMHLIFAVIYKKKKVDEWGNDIFEPYEFDVNARGDEFKDISIEKVYKTLSDLIDFKNKITNVYAEIFKTGEDEEDLTEDEKQDLTPEEIIEIEKAIAKEKKINAFAWQLFVHNLCQEDLTKASDVLKLPALFVFNNNVMLKRVKET